jgi:multicomponent Na+:H+ antiporter subunit F
VSLVWSLICVAEIGIGGALLIRVAVGPSVCDRIVALNLMSTQFTLALLAFAVVVDRSLYLDPAIWLASFSFLSALVWARYLERGLL